jgi:hypothetical protein
MQALFEKVGFERRGIIHNLDPGDPELIYCGTFKNFRGSNSRVGL